MEKHASELPGLGAGDKGTERGVWPRALGTRDPEQVCSRCHADYADAEDGLCTACWAATHVMEDLE